MGKPVKPLKPSPKTLRGDLTPGEIAKNTRLQRLYGITLVQYNQMCVQQKNRCKICFRPPKALPLYVDHDHKTGRVRGLLCFRCNHRLLARGCETAWIHQAAVSYLLDTFDGRNL